MPSYKLIYFPAKGRAETTRMLFAVAEKTYDDHRIDPQDWPELKPTMPYGQLPVLEIDGRKLAQSMAINRHLAREFGLAGRNPIEMEAVDGCCEVITELREKMMEVQSSKEPEAEKSKKLRGFKEVIAVELLEKLENTLKKNKGGDKFFYGDEISIADINFFDICEQLLTLDDKALQDSPKLDNLFDRVKNNAAIAKWLENRPQTEY